MGTVQKEGDEVTLMCGWGNIKGLQWGPRISSKKVLLLHAWLDNCHSFIHLGPQLGAAGFHCVALDLPGLGHSDPFPKGVACDDLGAVSVLYKSLRLLEWDTYSLVGHSMGGGMCLLLAAAFPDQVMSLVFLDASYLPPRPGTPKELHARVRAAILGEERLEREEDYIKVYKDREAAVERLMETPPYMKGRKVQTTLTLEAARCLVERGTRRVEGGVVFTRDRRWMLPRLDDPGCSYQLSLGSSVQCPHLLLEAEAGPKSQFMVTIIEEFKFVYQLLLQ